MYSVKFIPVKKEIGIWSLLLFLCGVSSCKEKSLSYQIPEKENHLMGEIWKNANDIPLYTDVEITDSYYVFTDYENESLLHVYDKNNPSAELTSAIHGRGATGLVSVEFVKSNTRYPSESDDVWIIDNKSKLKQVRCRKDSLMVIRNIALPTELNRSADYNITKDELYGVPGAGERNKAFYFFHPDSGYYWVDMYGMDKKYTKNDFACYADLIVHEKRESVVCAYRFFNKIQFFDLRGNISKDIFYGKDRIEPKDNAVELSNFKENLKCFIDIYATDQYVFCVYDGSCDYTNLSKIMIFKWDGTHVKTLQTDRVIKSIAVDKLNAYILALTANEFKGRDIVRYKLDKL
jgi:hypothetical protein